MDESTPATSSSMGFHAPPKVYKKKIQKDGQLKVKLSVPKKTKQPYSTSQKATSGGGPSKNLELKKVNPFLQIKLTLNLMNLIHY